MVSETKVIIERLDEIKSELDYIKRRIADVDSVLTDEDIEALGEAEEDYKKGRSQFLFLPYALAALLSSSQKKCFYSIIKNSMALATPSVAIPPGAITFTRIPDGATSSAKFLVNPQTPCLDVS